MSKYVLVCILLISLFPSGASADTEEPVCCQLCYPFLYSVTLFVPGLLALNILIEPDETWHEFSFKNFLNAYKSPPRDDHDSWVFNFLLHPLWGSETYLRARMNGCTWWQSWLFSNAMSLLWEYGFESWNEHPSIQDLLITGNIGSLLGEMRYRALIPIKKMKPSFLQGSLIFILDPIQTMVNGVVYVFSLPAGSGKGTADERG